MNAGMKNGINLLMILVLFISCVQEKEDNNVLRRVEACMELFPDSALSLLSQIECPECMRGQQRADYALLLTQALDKNYLDNLQSDSLIMIAVEYYKQEGDKLKAGKAYFYYGKVMLLKERFSDAMQAYLEASSLLEETRDYKVQGMVWEYIGYLNSVQGLYENSIDNFKHSIRYYELASDRRRILYGYRNMARGYFSVHHNDSAGWYAEKGLVLSDTVSGMKASFLHLLGLIANNEKRYPQAIEYFSNAMEVCDNLNDKYRYSLSLGRVYSEVGQKKKAEDCFVSCINATNIFVSSGAYYYLADMHKKDGNYLKAFLYKEKSDSLNREIQKAEIRETVASLQKKYENEKLQNENLQLKIKNQTIVWLCFLLALLVFLGAYYFYYRQRQNKKRIQEIEKQIVENREEIALYQEELVNYQELQSESEDYRTKIGELNGKVLLLQGQNKTLTERLNTLGGDIDNSCSPIDARYISTFRMLLSLKSGAVKGELSRPDWECLFDLFNYLYSDMLIRLQEEYPALTKHDLEICCLLKFGFTNDALKRVFFTTSDSITKAKGRLKKRLNISAQEDLDHFIRNY